MAPQVQVAAPRLFVFSDGERVPVLVDSETGLPRFEPTIYLLTCRRSRGLAANTLAADAACIRVLLCWAAVSKVDLNERFATCDYLNLAEVDDLARSLCLKFRGLAGHREPATETGIRVQPARRASLDEVCLGTAARRFFAVRHYLAWLADYHEPRDFASHAERRAARSRREEMLRWLDARVPQTPSGPLDPREGLSDSEVVALLSTCDPGGSSNPWRSEFVRDRNRLVIEMLLQLGLRKGELLGLRVSDINFQSNTVSIRRRPDDPKDPRRAEPNAKTRGRDLPAHDELVDSIRKHVMDHRHFLPNASKNGFLLLSRNGDPLSSSALNAIFDDLKCACDELPRNLSPHLLRHTWNDNYSSLMQERKVPETEEIRTRSYLMGWTETSGTAAKYTRRFVRQAAARASLALQTRVRRTKDE